MPVLEDPPKKGPARRHLEWTCCHTSVSPKTNFKQSRKNNGIPFDLGDWLHQHILHVTVSIWHKTEVRTRDYVPWHKGGGGGPSEGETQDSLCTGVPRVHFSSEKKEKTLVHSKNRAILCLPGRKSTLAVRPWSWKSRSDLSGKKMAEIVSHSTQHRNCEPFNTKWRAFALLVSDVLWFAVLVGRTEIRGFDKVGVLNNHQLLSMSRIKQALRCHSGHSSTQFGPGVYGPLEWGVLCW